MLWSSVDDAGPRVTLSCPSKLTIRVLSDDALRYQHNSDNNSSSKGPRHASDGLTRRRHYNCRIDVVPVIHRIVFSYEIVLTSKSFLLDFPPSLNQ